MAVVLLGVAACSGSDDGGGSGGGGSAEAGSSSIVTTALTSASTSPSTTAATSRPGGTTTAPPAASGETTTTLPAGARPGLFDFNQDGEKEPTCGTADFKAGLVVRTYCQDLSGYLHEPERGATLLPGALFAVPGPPDDPRDPPITSGASVSGQHLEAADGRELAVYTLTSDTVFATGSDQLLEPATASLTSIAQGLRASYPNATFQIRGHTDSTGDAAANQSLSERRGAAVANFFVSVGLDRSKVSSVGLGQTVPNYQEDTQVGRDQNRRVEIVVRL